jgi:hypothetical protein
MLERLEQLFPSTASMFCNRARRIGDFVFRLISRPNESLVVECPSYVALGHCWSNPQLATAEKRGQDGRLQERSSYLLPIPPLLWKALICELQGSSEGIWCDKICINQAGNVEKTTSIGLMGLVYQEARCVVATLADVVMTMTSTANYWNLNTFRELGVHMSCK